jgi:6-phosphogluconate dehydrogenase (decarboxylating)
MEETTVNTLQKAAEVLAGKTAYNYVTYRGKRFSRSAACSSHFANMVHNGCGVAITVSAAKEYIKSVITAGCYPFNVQSNCIQRFPNSMR